MRIISGKYRGMTIPMPKGGTIRPTTDQAREALFNILVNRYDLEGLQILDLFAGSGAMSIEFASRGAAEVHSVERNGRVVAQLKSFVDEKRISEVTIHKQDVWSFLKRGSEQVKDFDIVFADPPYAMNNLIELPSTILQSTILKNNGLLIIEHPSNLSWPDVVPDEQRIYGQTVFSLFTNSRTFG